MEYMSCAEATAKWGIAERRVQKLCESDHIPGAVKFSRVWSIPKDAEKPIDGRRKNNLNFFRFSRNEQQIMLCI